jgi:hypothetical protein
MSTSKNSDKKAVALFLDYLRKNGYSNVERLSTRSKITADVKAYSPEGKEIYFEVKSTEESVKCWSRITFNELESALYASKMNYDYYFVVIRKGNRSDNAVLGDGHRFIYPKNRTGKNKEFLSLDDILTFTKRHQFFFGIDINIDIGNSTFSATPVEKDPYTKEDIKKICDAISLLTVI